MHVFSPKKPCNPKSNKKPFFRASNEPFCDYESLDDAATKSLEHSKSVDKWKKTKPNTIKNIKGCPIKRTRRGYGIKNKNKREKGQKDVELTLLGSNANGLLGKQESLKSIINEFKPSIITIQESKTHKQGFIKIKGYQVFEKVRTGLEGGLLTAVHKSIEAVEVEPINKV